MVTTHDNHGYDQRQPYDTDIFLKLVRVAEYERYEPRGIQTHRGVGDREASPCLRILLQLAW